ncbi:MAG: tyrosine-type recombinase/integrase [Alphaproteobacteria bacterium GM202ARS2]|nr:tyrosine-type recombinase/integrase [Alphaproteobacteria bacterium GM202ARS2]
MNQPITGTLHEVPGLTPARLKVPALIFQAGERAEKRFFEFFTANIRNPNTRRAYSRAVADFCAWCDRCAITLDRIEPILVATYIETLSRRLSAPSVKLHLAAIRMLFDWLVTGQTLPMNPAAAVRGPKHVVKRGKTPVLEADDARTLLDSLPLETIAGLRDRALIGVMIYSFARVGAVCAMDVRDYYQIGKRTWFRLHEKGGKHHEVPAHHTAEDYVDAYLEAAGLCARDGKTPLFRTLDSRRRLTERRLQPPEVLAMVKRRAARAGLPPALSCHSFRATGITAYLANGGQLEHAREIAAHESPRTTMLYDRRGDAISLDEIERIVI